MRIAIGTDHRGFDHKEYLKTHKELAGRTIDWIDMGTNNKKPADYPVYAQKVCIALHNGQAQRGILLCGTGAGMAIVANRYLGIYAALVWSVELAKLSIEHDNSNILVLPADYVSREETVAMVTAWLQNEFLEGRHGRRVHEIDAIGGVNIHPYL
jgi:ribose 5-phosphate isomerase B